MFPDKVCNLQPRIKNIDRHIVFKKLASVFILCTFLLSITPKQVLHAIAADHKDRSSKRLDGLLQVNQLGFNCDCNSVVATSPFAETASEIIIPKLVHHSFYTGTFVVRISANEHFYFSLRGPPAVA